MSKLNFSRPNGQSRLEESSRVEVSKTENQRVTLDLPKELAIQVKMEAAKNSITMREIIITALQKYINQ